MSESNMSSFRVAPWLQSFCLMALMSLIIWLAYFIVSGYVYIKLAKDRQVEYLVTKRVNSILTSKINLIAGDIEYMKSKISNNDYSHESCGYERNILQAEYKRKYSYLSSVNATDLGLYPGKMRSFPVKSFESFHFASSFIDKSLFELNSAIQDKYGYLARSTRKAGINTARVLGHANRRIRSIVDFASSNSRLSELKLLNVSFNGSKLSHFNSSDVRRSFENFSKISSITKSIPSIYPMHYNRITSAYGRRTHPRLGRVAFHEGIDVVSHPGAHIFATNSGTVRRVGYSKTYGKYIEINHGNGITTFYAHLDKYIVRPGDKVKLGQSIGHQGNTGRSTGSHLHYEIRFRGTPVSPRSAISMRDNVRNVVY